VALRLRAWQARFLRACVSEPKVDAARALVASGSPAALETLPVLASFHRVVGHVVKAVGDAVPSHVRAALLRLQRDELARRVVAAENLRRTAQLLESLDIPFLVVKGPILAGVVYGDPRVRFYRDLDVIVPSASFPRALEAFEQTGARVVDANWPYFLEHLAGQVDLSSNVDLHWHLLFFEDFRRATRIRMADVFERARTVSAEGVTVRTLDSTDTLIHLAVHACLEGGARLGRLKDIEQVMVNERPDMQDVVERSLEWRLSLLVGMMLLRTRDSLSAPVGDDVLRALIPSAAWRGLLHSLDRMFPISGWTRRQTPAVRLAEKTQTSPPETIRHLARAATRRAHGPLRRTRAAGPVGSESRSRDLYLERVGRVS
jgi:hypothetical protein